MSDLFNSEKAHHKKSCARLALKFVEAIAIKNANALCIGFMHEPKIPEKLKNKNSENTLTNK